MGLPATGASEQLLLDWTFDLDDGSWNFFGPGWGIVNGQMIFTGINAGSTCFQNWPYTNGEWQRNAMYISKMDIVGWQFYGHVIDHLGQYVSIYQTNEPDFPKDYKWTGGMALLGEQMIFDWFSQMRLHEYLVKRYSLLDFNDQLYNLTLLPDDTFMFQYVSNVSGSNILLIYDPALDDNPI